MVLRAGDKMREAARLAEMEGSMATNNVPREGELADRVRDAVKALNTAVVDAKLAGLHVTLEVRSRWDMGEKYARHSVEADILKVL